MHTHTHKDSEKQVEKAGHHRNPGLGNDIVVNFPGFLSASCILQLGAKEARHQAQGRRKPALSVQRTRRRQSMLKTENFEIITILLHPGPNASVPAEARWETEIPTLTHCYEVMVSKKPSGVSGLPPLPSRNDPITSPMGCHCRAHRSSTQVPLPHPVKV